YTNNRPGFLNHRLQGRRRTMPIVREEIAADHDSIREVNRIAFGGNLEAELVERLRSSGVVVASLVAIENDEIVGHILSANSQLILTRASSERYRWLQWQWIQNTNGGALDRPWCGRGLSLVAIVANQSW